MGGIITKELNMSNTDNESVGSTIKTTQILKVVDNKCQASDFIVLSDRLGNNDWISKLKVINISSVGDVELLLKKPYKGNLDEGRDSVKGKALNITTEGESTVINVYFKDDTTPWELSHTHIIPKVLWNSYLLVFRNNEAVLSCEKSSKADENFTLNLGKTS